MKDSTYSYAKRQTLKVISKTSIRLVMGAISSNKQPHQLVLGTEAVTRRHRTMVDRKAFESMLGKLRQSLAARQPGQTMLLIELTSEEAHEFELYSSWAKANGHMDPDAKWEIKDVGEVS